MELARSIGVSASHLVGEELPSLNIQDGKGYFQNLELTRGDSPPYPSGLSPKEERDIESDLEDMMHSIASAAYEGDTDSEEDVEILKATLRAAMIQAKKMAKKKYTPKKYRKD